jgi:hypothetical protein
MYIIINYAQITTMIVNIAHIAMMTEQNCSVARAASGRGRGA